MMENLILPLKVVWIHDLTDSSRVKVEIGPQRVTKGSQVTRKGLTLEKLKK